MSCGMVMHWNLNCEKMRAQPVRNGRVCSSELRVWNGILNSLGISRFEFVRFCTLSGTAGTLAIFFVREPRFVPTVPDNKESFWEKIASLTLFYTANILRRGRARGARGGHDERYAHVSHQAMRTLHEHTGTSFESNYGLYVLSKMRKKPAVVLARISS